MDFKRMLQEKKFYLAVLLAFAGILIGTSWPDAGQGKALSSGTFLTMAVKALKSQTVLFLIPIAAVLPCGEEYLRERQWNFLRFLVIRRGKRDYCRDKVLTTALSGPLVWVFGTFLGVLFFFLLFFGREAVWKGADALILELFSLLGRIGLVASALASLSAAVGTVSGSVYLAFGLPFLLYYACIILRERYLEGLYCIDPSEWILGEQDWGSGGRGLWAFLILLAMFSALVHRILLESRLREL
ncbi:MAG: hypothetical protein Q4F41_01290 [Eubacteriales bacterium]|nr:hypothetical protein [Eubacteriales bacterium]